MINVGNKLAYDYLIQDMEEKYWNHHVAVYEKRFSMGYDMIWYDVHDSKLLNYIPLRNYNSDYAIIIIML